VRRSYIVELLASHGLNATDAMSVRRLSALRQTQRCKITSRHMTHQKIG